MSRTPTHLGGYDSFRVGFQVGINLGDAEILTRGGERADVGDTTLAAPAPFTAQLRACECGWPAPNEL